MYPNGPPAKQKIAVQNQRKTEYKLVKQICNLMTHRSGKLPTHQHQSNITPSLVLH